MNLPSVPMTSYGSLADPPATSVLLPAVSWLQGTLFGSIATAAAVIAIAAVGFMLLTGRVNVRHGMTVIVGSFVLFGATTIAAGIQARPPSLPSTPDAMQFAAPEIPVPPATPAAAPPAASDPYAGASVPTR